jgi:hypothetical protein
MKKRFRYDDMRANAKQLAIELCNATIFAEAVADISTSIPIMERNARWIRLFLDGNTAYRIAALEDTHHSTIHHIWRAYFERLKVLHERRFPQGLKAVK